MRKTFLKQRMKRRLRKIFPAFLILFFCLSFLTPVFSNVNTALAVSEVKCELNSDCADGLVCDMGVCVSDEPGIVPNPTLDRSCGVDMVLVIDSSSSMFGEPLQQEKDAFVSFVDAFLPNTPAQIAVVDFGTTATLLQDYTNDIDDLKTAINSATTTENPVRYTNWQDALTKAHDEFDNRVDAPDLYIFASDGNPYYGGATSPAEREAIEAQALSDAVTMANTIKSDGVRIVTLGIGDSVDADNLKAISSEDAYYASGFNTLADDLSSLADDLCGGTITVKKFVDDEPADGWVFSTLLEGGVPTTDTATTSDGGFATFEFDIDDSIATVDLSETPQDGYVLDSAVCTIDDSEVGTLNTNSVEGIEVGRNDQAYCEFYNVTDTTPKGSITINKITSTSTDLLFKFDGTLGTTSLANGNSKTYEDLSSGLYNFYETDMPNFWYNTSVDCGNASTTLIDGNLTVDLSTDENVTCTFTNSYQPPTPEPKGSISGCKYNDVGDDGNIEGDEKLAGWGIELWSHTWTSSAYRSAVEPARVLSIEPESRHLYATATTSENGCYSFDGLGSGWYSVNEVMQDHWTQTYASATTTFWFDPEDSSDMTYDFGNYKEEYCGDGVCNNEETCSTCAEDCTTGCGGGEIFGCTDPNATNYNSGADIDDDSCTYCGNGTCEANHDETCSTCSSDCGSCSSGGGGGSTPLCILRGDCGSSYIPPADNTEEVSNDVLVLGEEGTSNLTITKEVNVKQANPGDTLNYSILITNNGNLEAFNVNVTDTLPEGLVFVEDKSTSYTWSLGDIPAGESRDAHYQVMVLDTAEAGSYTNTAVVSADNNDDVSATANVEVIVPEVLAETGIDFGELAFLLFFGITAIVGSRRLRFEMGL